MLARDETLAGDTLSPTICNGDNSPATDSVQNGIALLRDTPRDDAFAKDGDGLENDDDAVDEDASDEENAPPNHKSI